MSAAFKYRLGFNELSSSKHRLWNALLAEFIGKKKFVKHKTNCLFKKKLQIIIYGFKV